MSVIEVGDVRDWLRAEKISVDSLDQSLAESHRDTVFARLSSKYDTSEWTDETNTPGLVKNIISMMVAASEFRGMYPSADDDAIDGKLMREANNLLEGIMEGLFDIVGVEAATPEGPSFFPDDKATTIAEEEGAHAVGAANQAFSMGQVF